MRKALSFLLLLLAFTGANAFCAAPPAEAPAPKAWRPFPELPEILWFDGFEIESNYYEFGKYHNEAPCPAGTHAFKLGEQQQGNDKFGALAFHVDKSPLRMPVGIDPKLINMQFYIYAEDIGDVLIFYNHSKGDYTITKHVPKANVWTPVQVKFNEFANKNAHPEAAQVCTQLKFMFKPHKGQINGIYIENLIITTNNVPPAEALPRALAAEKKSVMVRRRADKDGFAYSMQSQDLLKSAMKSANHPRNDRTVLVVAPPLPEGTQLDKVLASAAQKSKIAGFTFVPGVEPGGAPISGLDDMRTLIPFNLQKNESELVLLIIGGADFANDPRPAESVQDVVRRVLAAGSIPVVCLPSARGIDRARGILSSVIGICDQAGVPWVDQDFALKGVTTPYVGDALSPEGLESVASLALVALRHTADSLKK